MAKLTFEPIAQQIYSNFHMGITAPKAAKAFSLNDSNVLIVIALVVIFFLLATAVYSRRQEWYSAIKSSTNPKSVKTSPEETMEKTKIITIIKIIAIILVILLCFHLLLMLPKEMILAALFFAGFMAWVHTSDLNVKIDRMKKREEEE